MRRTTALLPLVDCSLPRSTSPAEKPPRHAQTLPNSDAVPTRSSQRSCPLSGASRTALRRLREPTFQGGSRHRGVGAGFFHGGLEVGLVERFGEGYDTGERAEVAQMVDFLLEGVVSG
jgi:hypothetical protein